MNNHSITRRQSLKQLLVTPALSLLSLRDWEIVPSDASRDESPLRGTDPLRINEDPARMMIDGIHQFLDGKLEETRAHRTDHWNPNVSSPTKYEASLRPQREHLAYLLGVREERRSFDAPKFLETAEQSALVGEGSTYNIFAIRWPVFGELYGEGLLLVPNRDAPVANILAVPDADQTPEQLVGLEAGIPRASQIARRLAESGCRVVVPALISREMDQGPLQEDWPATQMTHREFVYRGAYEMGRHIIGYELQKVLAIVDWFAEDGGPTSNRIGMIGWGEGGMLTLYAAALDTRIAATCVSGYFEPRQEIWKEPLDRNVFGRLERFGDAELASMVAPRPLIIEAARGPEFDIEPEEGSTEEGYYPPGAVSAPGRLRTPPLENVRTEVNRARELIAPLGPASSIQLVVSQGGNGPYGTPPTLRKLLQSVTPEATLTPSQNPPSAQEQSYTPTDRLRRQILELNDHNQYLLQESPYQRKKYFSDLSTDTLEAFEKTIESYRQEFAEDIIGQFEDPREAPRVRTRQIYDVSSYTGYEVVMDVFPDVIAHGILLLPAGYSKDEPRPVVVCQHGLEGRPEDTVEDTETYATFARRLAERGFITFAPQNPYIFGDDFRLIQRKAYPLGKTLFSIIVAQHRQITNWLSGLSYVDADRIGFYGLSYGGKTAMRVPPLVDNYALSICSGDFNDWIWKNVSTRSSYSYMWTGEYEMFEFNLGPTFNYAEMARLIAPRPFMVERGHFDGVAPNWAVASEYAKVRLLYEGELDLGDRTAIEFFNGPHQIHGEGTFDFLHRHLDWPVSEE